MMQDGFNSRGPLNGPEKAAVIIGLLGAESAGPIVEKIEDRHLRRFLDALGGLRDLPREIMLGAVADFIAGLNARKGGFRGGPDVVKDFVETLFKPDRVAELFGESVQPPKSKTIEEVWRAVKKAPIDDLIKYLSGQRIEIISIVLAQFPAGQSGEILNELPEELSVACVQYMARGVTYEPHIVEAIAILIRDEFFSADQADPSKDAALFISEVLGVLPTERRNSMLDLLEKSDPEKAALIRAALITFEDLPERLPSTAVSIIFKDFPADSLKNALKSGEESCPATIEFLYGNISQRMAGQLKEEVEELPVLSQKESDKAISALMSFIASLEKQGRITLIKKQVAED